MWICRHGSNLPLREKVRRTRSTNTPKTVPTSLKHPSIILVYVQRGPHSHRHSMYRAPSSWRRYHHSSTSTTFAMKHGRLGCEMFYVDDSDRGISAEQRTLGLRPVPVTAMLDGTQHSARFCVCPRGQPLKTRNNGSPAVSKVGEPPPLFS